ncbi:MAG: helix-turn-helix domain-containing protein [Candidatus Dormibacteria bacterium]
MSRPTLYARLARIESILGVDLNSVDSRLSLQVAMMAMAEARRGL